MNSCTTGDGVSTRTTSERVSRTSWVSTGALLGIRTGMGAMPLAALVVCALVRGPVSHVAAGAMYKIGGR